MKLRSIASWFFVFGFLFLVAGAVLISFRKEHGAWTHKALLFASLAAAFLAMSSVLTKYIFDHSNFISGMVWTRIGFIIPILPTTYYISLVSQRLIE